MKKSDYLSVNYHLLDACNMRCKFCFATFNDIPLSKRKTDEALAIVHQLAEFGFQKITFAGGEPTLRPDLPILLESAKNYGMTTMVVTNGSRLINTSYFESIKEHLDWLVLSIDSVDDNSNLNSGRFVKGGAPVSAAQYLKICEQTKAWGLRLKINTVVSRFNCTEDLSGFIGIASPERWKIFQALPVVGQNDHNNGQFEISMEEYNAFLERNRTSELQAIMVPEDNDAITGSYIMVAPNGCFFDDSKGRHTYSKPILDIGVEKALGQIHFDYKKFLDRGGSYDWR